MEFHHNADRMTSGLRALARASVLMFGGFAALSPMDRMLFAHGSHPIVVDSVMSGAPIADGVDTTWYRTPFPLRVGGVPLDIAEPTPGGYRFHPDGQQAEAFGHAAPFYADIDGDGKKELIVGSFAGRFRVYHNTGTNTAPVFPKTFTWLTGGGTVAQVLNYCCVAAGPQVADLDGDGIADISSGSYQPGAVYWWKGLGNNQFAPRQLLTTADGIPIFSHLETLGTDISQSFMSNVAYGDFFGTGHLDMVLGDFLGELFLLPNAGVDSSALPGAAAYPTQPVFGFDRHVRTEIRIHGERAIPHEYHAAPAVADWDGDGLLDILVGTEFGRVYLLRNTGTKQKPEFASRVLLLDRGEGVEQWVMPGRALRRGIRAQIQVVDYNGDGKPDLLVGDWTFTVTPRANLTQQDKARLAALRDSLDALDKRLGFTHVNWRHKWPPYGDMGDSTYKDNRKLLELSEHYLKAMAPYLEKYEVKPGLMAKDDDEWGHMKAGGHVWIFLRK